MCQVQPADLFGQVRIHPEHFCDLRNRFTFVCILHHLFDIPLQKITLPESLARIGNRAFSGCRTLRQITFPAKLTGFGESPFEGCKELILSVYSGSPGEEFCKKNGLKHRVI